MWEEAASEFTSLPPHATHKDAGTDSNRGGVFFFSFFSSNVEVEVTRGGGNTKGNPHLHLETKRKTPETQDANVFVLGGKKKTQKRKKIWSSFPALSLSGLGAKARGGRKEVEEEEEEEGVRAGESGQDLWGLQGCTEQMQNNLTLPRPDAVALGEAQL